MNAHAAHLIHDGLVSAFKPVPTMAEFFTWGRRNGSAFNSVAVEIVHGVRTDTPLPAAKSRLDAIKTRETLRFQRNDWKADSNVLCSAVELLAAIKRFEAARSIPSPSEHTARSA